MNNENNGAAIDEQAAGYGGVGVDTDSDSDSDSDSDPDAGSTAAGLPNKPLQATRACGPRA